MSDLVGNPEDRFSQNEAQIFCIQKLEMLDISRLSTDQTDQTAQLTWLLVKGSYRCGFEPDSNYGDYTKILTCAVDQVDTA